MNNIPLCENPWAPSLSKSHLLSNGQVLWETTAQVSKGTGASVNEFQWMQGSCASKVQVYVKDKPNAKQGITWGLSMPISLLGRGDRQEKYMCSGHSHSREDKNLSWGSLGNYEEECVVWCGGESAGRGPQKGLWRFSWSSKTLWKG